MSQAKKLYRNKEEAKLLGVCAGLADYFDTDVTLIRLIWVILVLCFGTGILAYLIGAIIIPEKPAQ